MDYIGATINESPTIVRAAGADITTGPFTAVALSGNTFIPCTADLVPFGLTLAEVDATIKQGSDVTAQIKEIGMWKSGAVIAAGDAVTSNANGCAVKAGTGKFILGFALTAAAAAGDVIQVQISKSGYAV